MKKLTLLLIVASSVVVIGCGENKAGETPGYTQKDFAKSEPPPGYINNVPKGPASSPPTNR